MRKNEGIAVTFYVEQARNVDDVASTNPWADDECDHVDCTDTGECESEPDISWVGFCAEEGEVFSVDQFDFEVDGDSLHLHEAPESLKTLLLKYGTYLDVFEDPTAGESYHVGGGVRYGQYGEEFSGTNGPRSNSDPCPGTCALKYEVDEDNFELKGCEE